jgi:uncharacterized protein (DUF2141 family)
VRALLAGVAACVAVLACGRATGAAAADLTIRIEGVRSDRGNIYTALFATAASWPDGDRAEHQDKAPARRGTVTVVFRGLAPGIYAIGGFHDENGNGEFDKNFLGVPKEGFFVSNVTGLVLSTPAFAEVAFALPPEGRTVTVRMRYY